MGVTAPAAQAVEKPLPAASHEVSEVTGTSPDGATQYAAILETGLHPFKTDRTTGRLTAEKLAKTYGMRVKWVTGDACASVPRSVGCFYFGTGPLMTISNRIQTDPLEGIRNVVRHEAAHYRITQRCGTPSPKIINNGRTENITDAYATLYHHHSRSGYGYNSNDLKFAKVLHDNGGTCTKTQKKVTSNVSGATMSAFLDGSNNSVSKSYAVSRGMPYTYYYRNGNMAYVKDKNGKFGYVPMYAITNKNQFKQVTVHSPEVRTSAVNGSSARYNTSVGEKFRVVEEHTYSYLAISNDGSGNVVNLSKRNTVKPGATKKLQPGSRVYDVTNDQLTEVGSKGIPDGAKVSYIRAFDSNYDVVTYAKKSFIVLNKKLK